MKVFVGGSLRDVPLHAEECGQFVEHLGEQIVIAGHVLHTGARGSLDTAISAAAVGWLAANEKHAHEQVVSWRLEGEEAAHRNGQIQISELSDWELNHPRIVTPEQIERADVAVFVAGSEGTFLAANFARFARKPVLGVAQFGGAGRELFHEERRKLARDYASFVDASDFDILNQDTDDFRQLAVDVVKVCVDVLTPTAVFTIMPFEESIYDDVFDSYKTVCEEFGFDAVRTDQSNSLERIVPRILNGIRTAAFVIADVTHTTPNVFYEVGYAQGLGRPVILTARDSTELPFDIADVPVLFWETQSDLKKELRGRVREIKSSLPGPSWG